MAQPRYDGWSNCVEIPPSISMENLYPAPNPAPFMMEMSAGMPDVHKRDKDAIYGHPLFPLLCLIFERCEQATTCPPVGPSAAGTYELHSDSFKEDMTQFCEEIRAAKPFYLRHPEVDSLMIQAINVLRYHLQEMEKVHELCDDFIQRYIACIKAKTLRDDIGGGGSKSEYDHPTEESPTPDSQTTNFIKTEVKAEDTRIEQNENFIPRKGGNENFMPRIEENENFMPRVGENEKFMANGGGDENSMSRIEGDGNRKENDKKSIFMLGGRGGFYENPIPVSRERNMKAMSRESTGENVDDSISKINTNDDNDVLYENASSEEGLKDNSVTIQASSTVDNSSEGKDGSPPTRKQSKKNGIFSKVSTNILRTWLFQHLSHPYPSEEQKKQLVVDTGLSLLQVNNWFINARRRIVQPIIDQSNTHPPTYFPRTELTEAATRRYSAMPVIINNWNQESSFYNPHPEYGQY